MHNVGKNDRIIRLSVAGILVLLYFAKLLPESWSDGLLIGAGILGVTSLKRCCPLYALLGFGTCSTGTNDNEEPRIKTEKLKLD
ncbi:MAG: DUF2892 domain-containing protein [Bacteroidetes bacterium HGW-Bacteroidetes-4]|nr:MAG: DUF2892 domain-containing protein [Bacteroidetes bacterium HGW-Bacteroidetes-4]